MSEEEKLNKETQGENAKAEEPAKKEGKFTGFFKKMSQKLDDATYDSRLVYDFEKNHASYQVYTGTGVFSASPEIAVEEHLDGDEKYVIAIDVNDAIKAGCLIKKSEGGAKVYHIAAVELTTLNVEFEGKTNEKSAQKIVLGDEAEKVNVIKVGDDFYRV